MATHIYSHKDKGSAALSRATEFDMTNCLEEKFHYFNQAVAMNSIAANSASLEVPHEGAMCDLMWSDPEDLGQSGHSMAYQ